MELFIGKKVYQQDGIRIYESTIIDIICDNNRLIYDTDSIAFDDSAIGTSIFLTRKEAEKALTDWQNK